ncbi:hypothetical protein IWQ61_003534 [Dispira simplex]|nr:hypothetical protein IWQ61_003534 [Dispira simplex]
MSYGPPPGSSGPGGNYSSYAGSAQYGPGGAAYGHPGGNPYGGQQGYGNPPPGGNYGGNPYAGQQQGYGAHPPTSQPPQSYGSPYPPPAQPQQPAGPPTPEMLRHWFNAVDEDKSGALSAAELQRALVNGDWSPFNIETVRMMVNMFDKDNSGTISFDEFAGLWKYIEEWKRCFMTFDRDRSGTIDGQELTHALRTFGYNVSPEVIKLLICKFDINGNGTVTFDNFIQACVTVRTLTEAFKRFDTDNDGWVQICYKDFLMLVINGR